MLTKRESSFMISENTIFGRERELAVLTRRLAQRQSFLLHGPAGIGKTALACALLPGHSEILYCPDASSKQVIFRSIATALAANHKHAAGVLGGSREIKTRSAVSLKGIVLDLLLAGEYWVALDHLRMPSQVFAADIKEIVGRALTPVLGIARSDHMEDVGFLKSLFIDRSEKMELHAFDDAHAGQFAKQVMKGVGIAASNAGELLTRVVQLSRGNPGAIVTMLSMAKLPKYRSGEQILVSPLYVDFRLRSVASR
jgi:hypothetical protein